MRNFFRPEADLLVIIVSDEDDCSTGGPKEASILASKPGQFRRLRCATFGHMCDGMPLEAREQSLPLATCRDLVSTEQLVAIPDILPKLEEIRTSKREGRAAMKISGEPRIMIASLSGWPSQADLPTARYEYRRFTSPVSGESMLDLAPVCGQGEGAARPGLRLRRLAERLPPGDGLYLSICGDDLRPALIQAASLP